LTVTGATASVEIQRDLQFHHYKVSCLQVLQVASILLSTVSPRCFSCRCWGTDQSGWPFHSLERGKRNYQSSWFLQQACQWIHLFWV